jgi:hypothetical protein
MEKDIFPTSKDVVQTKGKALNLKLVKNKEKVETKEKVKKFMMKP